MNDDTIFEILIIAILVFGCFSMFYLFILSSEDNEIENCNGLGFNDYRDGNCVKTIDRYYDKASGEFTPLKCYMPITENVTASKWCEDLI